MDNRLFFSYIEPSEMNYSILEAAFDIDVEKLHIAYEYTSSSEELNLKKADYKLLAENGTYSDMYHLYESVVMEATEKKKGIISSIIDRILKFIDDIFESIRNLFGGKKEQKFNQAVASGKISGNANVKKDPNKVISTVGNLLKKVGGFIKPGFTKMKDGEKVFSPIKTLVTAAETVGVGVLAYKAFPSTKKKLEALLDQIRGLTKKVETEVAVSEEPDVARQTVVILQNASKEVGSSLNELTKIMNEAIDAEFKEVDSSDSDSDAQPQIAGNKQMLLTGPHPRDIDDNAKSPDVIEAPGRTYSKKELKEMKYGSKRKKKGNNKRNKNVVKKESVFDDNFFDDDYKYESDNFYDEYIENGFDDAYEDDYMEDVLNDSDLFDSLEFLS